MLHVLRSCLTLNVTLFTDIGRTTKYYNAYSKRPILAARDISTYYNFTGIFLLGGQDIVDVKHVDECTP